MKLHLSDNFRRTIGVFTIWQGMFLNGVWTMQEGNLKFFVMVQEVQSQVGTGNRMVKAMCLLMVSEFVFNRANNARGKNIILSK